MNSTKEYVNSLFSGYEDTAALADFKEELLSNLNAKIESMVKKGIDEGAAFEKAAAELGDLSALADEISLKKRQEVFEERYLDVRRYMKPKRILGYIACGVSIVLGLVIALIVYLAERDYFGINDPALPYMEPPVEYLAAVFGVLLPFFTAAASGLAFLLLTQETAARYAMTWKRALWYTLAAFLLAFGIMVLPLIYFGAGKHEGLIGGLVALISFVLPGAGLLAFLVLTEKNLLKPWAKERLDKEIQKQMVIFEDQETAGRFGMISGAIWIFALGLFVLLGFLLGFRFSWIVFIFAVAGQLLVQALMYKTGRGPGINSGKAAKE